MAAGVVTVSARSHMAAQRLTRVGRSRLGRLSFALFTVVVGRRVWATTDAAFVPAPSGASSAAAAQPLAPMHLATAGAAAGGLVALGGAQAAGAAGEAALVAPPIDPSGAIVQAFLLTFVSEIGDKTFFIAAILAAGGSTAGEGQNQKLLTFIGAIGALVVMTLLAVALGQIFHSVPDVAGGVPIDDYVSILAFGFFGVKLLSDAVQMQDDGSLLEEKEEAEEEVKGALPSWMSGGAATLVIPPLVLQAFVLVFAAEIGDRSFISAAALSAQGGFDAATQVFVGGISAHALATLGAVLVGDVIARYVTEKQLAYIGGSLFLVFAATSALKAAGIVGA